MKLFKSSALLLVLAAMATGCAASRRESYMQDKAHEHVYRMPLAELWPQARTLVTDKGYSLMENKGGYELQTEWLQTSAASSLGTTYQRYLLRGHERGPGQSSVEFIKMVRNETRAADGSDGAKVGAVAQTTGANQAQPDLEMELELLKRVDAEAAKKYQDEAQQKFQ